MADWGRDKFQFLHAYRLDRVQKLKLIPTPHSRSGLRREALKPDPH